MFPAMLKTLGLVTKILQDVGKIIFQHFEPRLYSDIGHLLDEKFRMVYNLTYNTMASHEDVDTTMLRRALFNYVHCMFGIRYDDYDYGEVNQLLERNLKIYIKTVTCYPERTTKRMYDSYWRQFKHSEKRSQT
ncbi:hypothetical protein E2320_005526 [Naja naja]|nr:hypothetical protein E2320_005526 [Naja naja]